MVRLADRASLLLCGLFLGTAWAADEASDEEVVREVEFIEYLGLWVESDEEWLMYGDVRDSEALPETEIAAEPETGDES
jgi:hypothetical protein